MGCVCPMVIWSISTWGSLETTSIVKTHSTLSYVTWNTNVQPSTLLNDREWLILETQVNINLYHWNYDADVRTKYILRIKDLWCSSRFINDEVIENFNYHLELWSGNFSSRKVLILKPIFCIVSIRACALQWSKSTNRDEIPNQHTHNTLAVISANVNTQKLPQLPVISREYSRQIFSVTHSLVHIQSLTAFRLYTFSK